MPPKKEPPKASGAEGEEEGLDPTVLASNYQKMCKSYGLPCNNGIIKYLNDEEKQPITQLVVDADYGLLGPGGTRALMTAIMGSGVGMKGGPYKLLNSIRLWKCNIGDDGAAAIAEVLRLGGGDVKIAYLELLDDNIGAKGGMALGLALSKGGNLSLLTLKLDYNKSFSSQGVVNLCKGLKSNVSLKQLHLCYCNITSEGCQALSDVMKFEKSVLTVLNLNGNPINGHGLYILCDGLLYNKVLENINLSDTFITDNDEGYIGLNALKELIECETSALTAIDLSYNSIGENGGNILLPAIEKNKKLEIFYVDSTLSNDLFEKIFRDGGGKKKGKKGKK